MKFIEILFKFISNFFTKKDLNDSKNQLKVLSIFFRNIIDVKNLKIHVN